MKYKGRGVRDEGRDFFEVEFVAMGRMLDALRQGEGQRSNPVPALINEGPPTRTEVAVTPPEVDPFQEEFPYIEVGGGPGKKMEASAVVLAAPATKSEKKSPAPPRPESQGPLVPTLSRPRPMSVAFEPWPASSKPCPASEIITYHQPDHAVSKQYDSLFEQIAEGSRAVVFAGAKGAGTTTVLLNLAFSGCMRFGKRLAVVESGSSRPALAQRLGIPPSPGWAEFLAGSIALEKALQSTAHPQLSALIRKEKSEDIPAEALGWVLGWLRDRFDLVLIDGPDIEDEKKLASLADACDGLYLVLPQNTEAPQKLARAGMRLRGVIHTQFENV